MKDQNVDKKLTIQVRIERGLHPYVVEQAKMSKTSIKDFLEGLIIEHRAKKLKPK